MVVWGKVCRRWVRIGKGWEPQMAARSISFVVGGEVGEGEEVISGWPGRMWREVKRRFKRGRSPVEQA